MIREVESNRSRNCKIYCNKQNICRDGFVETKAEAKLFTTRATRFWNSLPRKDPHQSEDHT